MPKIQKIFEIDVTPEKFLNACSKEELIELEMLLGSSFYQAKMNPKQYMFTRLTKKEQS